MVGNSRAVLKARSNAGLAVSSGFVKKLETNKTVLKNELKIPIERQEILSFSVLAIPAIIRITDPVEHKKITGSK